LILALFPSIAAAQDDAEKVYKQLIPSTVWIFVPKELSQKATGGGVTVSGSTGSGVLVDEKKRVILTNYHVVLGQEEVLVHFPIFTDAKKLRPEPNRKRYTDSGIVGKVVATEPSKDLALVQLIALPPGVRAVKVCVESPNPGQKLHSIGNPGATEALWSYTSGNVRQVKEMEYMSRGRGGDDKPIKIAATMVITDSPVNAGDSGGPVVNNRGELVALVQGHQNDGEARLVSVFIDATEIAKFLKKHLGKVATAPVVAAAKTPVEPKTEPKAEPEKKAPPSAEPKDKVEEEAASLLRKAKFWASSGDTKTAREKLNDLIKRYPKTKAAESARQVLEDLGK
jgi:S1-C subfamily serine protease